MSITYGGIRTTAYSKSGGRHGVFIFKVGLIIYVVSGGIYGGRDTR